MNESLVEGSVISVWDPLTQTRDYLIIDPALCAFWYGSMRSLARPDIEFRFEYLHGFGKVYD